MIKTKINADKINTHFQRCKLSQKIGRFIMRFKKRHLVKQLFPVVLCHESEEGQECPAEGIKTGVAIVWIPPYF